MRPDETLLHTFMAALALGGASPPFPELADHVTLHIPGRTRFAGDYFGKVAVVAFWQAQQALWEQLTIENAQINEEQLIARVAAQTSAQGTPFLSHGAFLLQIRQAQIWEWWWQPDDQTAFDAYWAYRPAVSAPVR